MLKCPKCLSDKVVRHSHSSSGRQRYSCKSCGHRTVSPIGLDHIDESIERSIVADNLRSLKKTKRWVITSAQNATPVNKAFLKSLEVYCEYTNSQLVVVPYRYRNPTSIFTDKDHDWWDENIVPYLLDQRVSLCPGLMLLGDIKVQPTASTPLSGLEGFTGGDSCIVGHPKYQMSTVPTRQGHMAKIMTTTGSCTVENYTASKAGKKGIHHHVFGAIIAETDGQDFFIRHVSSGQDGEFYDLDKHYSPEGVQASLSVPTLTLGDLHHWWMDKATEKATFGEKGIIETLNPNRILLHDCIDSFSISHHHKSPFLKYAKAESGKNSIKDELSDFAGWLDEKLADRNPVIVSSNHHEHVKRWLEETDWRSDLTNADFYLETALWMLRNSTIDHQGENTPDPFTWWIGRLSNHPNLTLLDVDDSFEVAGVEHGNHGHYGPNGARGSLNNLSKIGSKITFGHGHSPGTRDGAYMAGVCTEEMSYAKGPSSWLQSHVVLYPDGKRSHITIINGKWRA